LKNLTHIATAVQERVIVRRMMIRTLVSRKELILVFKGKEG
jgi:hypothetical protein